MLKKTSKTIGAGGGGTCRVYYSEKFKRKVVEKRVDENFFKRNDNHKTRMKTAATSASKGEAFIKEMILMILTQIAELDCCVQILDIAVNPYRIIMEYCEGGDLREILNTYDVPVQDKVIMISQILIAIKKIHDVGFIHGDLKCRNIFLVNKYIPGDFKNIRIKIGDFGLSEIGGNLVFGGTPGFMAPEVPEIGGSFASDIYSIGKVMLEIMTGLPVQMIAAINIRNLFSIKNKLPKFLNASDFYNAVIPCLYEDPKKRITATQLCIYFEKLMSCWLLCEKISDNMLKNYKLGETVPVDTHKHPLILSNDEMRNYKGERWYCDICQNKNACYFTNTLSFNCRICKYDLCDKFIAKHNYRYINTEMKKRASKGKKVYVSLHEHYLLLSNKEEREYEAYYWICDICKNEPNYDIDSFHCKKCGYDVCLTCYDKYNEKREKECCCIIF